MKKLLLLIVVSILSLNTYAHGGASAMDKAISRGQD